MTQRIRDVAQQCFRLYHLACVTMRAQQLTLGREALRSSSLALLQNNGLDARAQRVFQDLLQTGEDLCLYFALQNKVFVGIDDGNTVLCLACAGTLQGQDAIPDLFAWCQRYAVYDTNPIAGCLNCEICNEPLIPSGYPGTNT